ncbi:hypothetical protein BJX64DRAFT_260933 [Aspergillus heterothallicus]
MTDRQIKGSPNDAAADTINEAFPMPSESRVDERNELSLASTPDVTEEYKLAKRKIRGPRFADLPEDTPAARAEFLERRIENLHKLASFYASQKEPRVFDTDMAQSALDMLESIFEPRPMHSSGWPRKKGDTFILDKAIITNPFLDTAQRTAEDLASSSREATSRIKADEALAKQLPQGPQELPSEHIENKRTKQEQTLRASSSMTPAQPMRTSPSSIHEKKMQRPQIGTDRTFQERLADGPFELPSERVGIEKSQQKPVEGTTSSINPTQSLRPPSRLKERVPAQKMVVDDPENYMKKIDKQLKEFNANFGLRNQETREAYECFKKLMIEYKELKADNARLSRYHQEDTSTLEGLHGTLAAFQNSINTWMQQQASAAIDRQTALDQLIEQRQLEAMSIDMLSDNIKGFMNGWNDAKVEFDDRRSARKRPKTFGKNQR